MYGLRKTLVFSTLLLGTLSTPAQTQHNDALVDWDQFQALLDTISPAALHSVLHSLSPKFQDGVFSKDRSAIEHVHSEDPVVASKLVHIAKKRQVSNGTTTTSTPADTSAAQSSSSIAASISSALSSAILASTVPAETTLTVAPSQPPSATPVSTGDGFVVYSTFGGGLVTLTSSAVGVHFTPSTSTRLYYTTLPDGDVSTSTSVLVVNAPMTEGGESGAAASTTGSSPGLQDGAESLQRSSVLSALVAAVGGWLMLAF